MLLSKAEQDVEENAAGSFMGLHKHDIHFRNADVTVLLRAVCGWLDAVLAWLGSTGVRHRKPRESQHGEIIECHSNLSLHIYSPALKTIMRAGDQQIQFVTLLFMW